MYCISSPRKSQAQLGHRPTEESEQGGCGGLPYEGRSGGGTLKRLGKRNVSGRAAVGSSIAYSLTAVSQPSHSRLAGLPAINRRKVPDTSRSDNNYYESP